MLGISSLALWISTLLSWVLPPKPEKKVEYIVNNGIFFYTDTTSSTGGNTITIGSSGDRHPSVLVEADQCDITNEEYEEAVSVLELLQEKGITKENEELLQEMKTIIEEFEG